MHQHDTDLLARLPLFSKVDLVSVRPILGRCEEHEFPVGHLLIDPKRGSAVAYVLLHGRLEGKQTGFLATGEEVRKLGDQEYEFEQGSFTTCRCPDGGEEPWVIRAEQAELEIGGYGTARNTVVDVLGVPVFWLPWMKYPLLTDRATGLLFPVFNSSSRTGFDVGHLDFYIVLAHFKLAVILENMHARFMGGGTVGPGFEQIGAQVLVLARSGMAVAERSEVAGLRDGA